MGHTGRMQGICMHFNLSFLLYLHADCCMQCRDHKTLMRGRCNAVQSCNSLTVSSKSALRCTSGQRLREVP